MTTETTTPKKSGGLRIGLALPALMLITVAALIVFSVIQRGQIEELGVRLDAALAEAPETVAVALPITAEGEAAPEAPKIQLHSAGKNAVSIASLDARLAKVEQALQGRQAQRWDGTGRPRPGVAAVMETQEEGADEVVALREDVDALLTGEGLESEEAKAKVEEMMEAARDRRRTQRREIGRQRTADSVARIGEELRLTEETQGQVSTLIQDSRERRWERRHQVRDGELTYTEARAAGDIERAETEGQLEDLLGVEDYEAFKAKWDDRSRRRGF